MMSKDKDTPDLSPDSDPNEDDQLQFSFMDDSEDFDISEDSFGFIDSNGKIRSVSEFFTHYEDKYDDVADESVGDSTFNNTIKVLNEYFEQVDKENLKEEKENLQRQFKQTYTQNDMEMKKHVEYCQHFLSEYFSDFIVIGHSYNGKRIQFEYNKTRKDKDALMEAFKCAAMKVLTPYID